MSESFIFNKTVENYLPFKSLVDGSITNVTEEMVRGITRIDDFAFYCCETLTGCFIPNTVTSIRNGAFNGCISLQSVEIPNSVTSIGEYTFFNCTSLQTVTMRPTTPPTLGNNSVFNNTHSDLVIYVPAGSVETYKTASGWSYYASKIQAIPSS